MARRNPPGWYPTENGGTRRWDGQAWTSDHRPPPPSDPQTIGWRAEARDVFRWWAGSRWSDARACLDGRIDAARNIGQAVLTLSQMGGTDKEVIGLLMEELQSFPPSRIEQIQTYTSAVVAGTSLMAVVSWPPPRT